MARITGDSLIKNDLALRAWLDLGTKERAAAGTLAQKTRRLYDGTGFYLLDAAGKKPGWRLEYKAWSDKQGRMADNMVSLGTYPAVSLAVAREKVKPLRDEVARGEDPAKARAAAADRARAQDARARADMERLAQGLAPVGSFQDVAEALHADKLLVKEWQATHAADFLRIIKRNFSLLCARQLASITEEDLKAALDVYTAQGKHATAKDMLEMSGQIFTMGRKLGHCKHNIAADLKDYIQRPATKHHPKIKDQNRLGDLVKAIRAHEAKVIAAACMLQVMLFQRSSNTVGIRWADIDVNTRCLKIEAGRVKLKAEQKERFEFHIVPLPKQALRLLMEMHKITGHNEYVFVARRDGKDQPINRRTMLSAFREMGFGREEMNSHGLRGTAFTAIASHIPGDYKEEVEANLAHVYGGNMGATYNEAEYVEKRRPMLQLWADHLDALADGSWQKAEQEKAEAAFKALQEEFGTVPDFTRPALRLAA